MIAISTRHWTNGFKVGRPRTSFGGALVGASARWCTNDLAFMSLSMVKPVRDIDREICRLALLSCDGDEPPPPKDRWM